MTTPPEQVEEIGPGRELATVAGSFLTYGSMFFNRLAPLHVVALIATELGVPSAAEGTLALLIGLGCSDAHRVGDDRTLRRSHPHRDGGGGVGRGRGGPCTGGCSDR